MGLETATYINGLVATNPVGATDPKSAGDDHLRLIKATLLATFAGITGAVTATHTELNYVHGATGTTGSGNLVLSASPTFTGTIGAASLTATGTVAAATLTGAGSGITALNASNLASGTVPDARFPATLPAASGANLTALNASNISSGSLADARLSANVPLLNAANVFTSGTQSISAGTPLIRFTETDGSANNKVWDVYVDGEQLVYRTVNDAINSVAIYQTVDRTGTAVDQIAWAATTLSFTGNASTPNTSASEVGYKGAPHRTVSASDNTAAADAGCTIKLSGTTGAQTFTLDADPAADSELNIVNTSTQTWTIAASSSLTYAGVAGSKSLQAGFSFRVWHSGSGVWYVVGAG